jgi:outer membrane protein assembly factor BamB
VTALAARLWPLLWIVTWLAGAQTVAADGDWPTYHRDAGRSGVDPSAPAFTSVEPGWTSAELDADIYAEPLYVSGRVLIATENNSVYALDASSGAEVWHAELDPPATFEALKCGNVRPVIGITGTPAADPDAGVLYAVALVGSPLHYELYALNLEDGTIQLHRSIDPPGLDPRTHGQRGALLLANGQVYATFGNRSYPSCEPWTGRVVAASATDPEASLAVYSVQTSRAGIWASGGAVADDAGHVYVATGDGPASGTVFGRSESVIKLSPALDELDFWAPADWQMLDQHDIDIGSVSPTLLPDMGLIFQGGKNSYGYLIPSEYMGGIGGDVYQEQVLPGQCGGVFGSVVYQSPILYVPCGPSLVALKVTRSRTDQPGKPGFSLVWQVEETKIGVATIGSPILAGGAAWNSDALGRLWGIDALTGKVRFQAQLPGLPAHFATPTSGGGRIYATGGHFVAAFNLIP